MPTAISPIHEESVPPPWCQGKVTVKGASQVEHCSLSIKRSRCTLNNKHKSYV